MNLQTHSEEGTQWMRLTQTFFDKYTQFVLEIKYNYYGVFLLDNCLSLHPVHTSTGTNQFKNDRKQQIDLLIVAITNKAAIALQCKSSVGTNSCLALNLCV